MDFKLVDSKIDNLKEDMIKDLQSLISIKSVVEEEKDGMPFGEGVQNAFEFMLSLAKREDMETFNVDNYGGHIDFGEEYLANTMGILCHLDVVPEGSDWTKEPYGGEIVDGKLYGRGTVDDKGPTMACFYAMKVLKDMGYIPKKKVRMILGLDEETNWYGMDYYFSKVKPPSFGIAPDADFPVIHGEKGIADFDICKKIGSTFEKGLELRNLKGGNASNMVSDKARTVIYSVNQENYQEIKDSVERYRERTGYTIKAKAVGKSLEITTEGVSAHGATPELGLNAISILFDFLKEIKFANEDVNEFVKFYCEHIGFELNGKSLGCYQEDEISGKLTVNVGIVEADKGSIKITINARHPVTKTQEEVYENITEVLNKYNLGLIKKNYKEPIYVPKDSPMVKTLMDIYKRRTGRDDEPIVIGGGTYARACDNVLAFGPRFVGDADCVHKKDEHVDIDHLIQATKIYAETIYMLTKDE